MSKIINILEKQKNDYYKNDIWDLTKHPDKQIAEFFSRKLYKYRSLNFAKVSSNTKKQQLKASIKWNADKAKWNSGATPKWKAPKGYNRVNVEALLKAFN